MGYGGCLPCQAASYQSLGPDKAVVMTAAAEAYRRLGDQSVYAEDTARAGVIPVKSMM